MRKLIVGAIVLAAAAAAGLGAAFTRWSAPDPLPPVSPPGPWLLADPRPVDPPFAQFRPRPSMRGLGWQVIDYLSALGVLIVEVETHRLDETLGIAHALVEPLKESYIEVLVYFSEPGRELAAQRVQWTPEGGYVRTDISVR